jgi:hypothetical protein
MLHIGDLHLRVPIPAESALPVEFSNLSDSWMAQERFSDPWVVLDKFLQDRQNPWRLSIDGFMYDQSTVSTQPLSSRDFGAFLETSVQSLRHLLFVGIRTKCCFLLLVR